MLPVMTKNLTIVLAAMALLVTTGTTSYARDAFDGNWKVTASPADDAPRNGAREFTDTLLFKGSKLQSAYCVKNLKLAATTYDEDTRGGVAATFKCEMKNDKEKTKAVWSGTSTGAEITGELTITKADGSEQKYSFKGEKSQ